MTLEKLLAEESDSVLAYIQRELSEALVPSDGYTHSYIRKVNTMIDDGELCINETTYRKVYLPTFARAVHKELARRWSTGKRIVTPMEHIAQYAKTMFKVDDITAVDIAYKLHDRIDDLIEEIIDEHDGDD